MSRKHSFKKENKVIPEPTTATLPAESAHTNRRLKIYLGLIITILAFLLYAQTATYKFTLDDGSVIVQNKLVQKGMGGIKEILSTDYWYGYTEQLRGLQYRPASLLMFAVEEEFFPGQPGVHHLVNVILYALTCLLLFLLIAKIFPSKNLLLPFVTILLYTAHPVHTEVVSNIKSRDEILCFLFGIAALFAMFKYHASRRVIFLALSGLAVFLSITSKETGIAFVLLIPLVLYFTREVNGRFMAAATLSLVAFAALYFFIRHQVVKDVQSIDLLVIDNTLVAAQSKAEQFATAFTVLLKYLGLLLLPHPLSYDYSFSQVKIVSFSDAKALFSLFLYLALGIFAVLNTRKKNPYALAIFLFLLLLAPVSNIFLKIGSTMAERFLYMPSLGFCLALGLLSMKLSRVRLPVKPVYSVSSFFTQNVTVITAVLLAVILYSFKTVSRNKDWQDNVHLFGKDVQTSPNSARTHYNWGLSNIYDLYLEEEDPGLKKEYLEEGRRELETALDIYPEYFEAEKPLGYVHLKQGAYETAVKHFDQYLVMNPKDVATLNNKAAALMGMQMYQGAIPVLELALAKEPSDTSAVKNLGRCYAYTQQFSKAIEYFLKSIQLSPGVSENYRLAGMAYQFLGDSTRARPYLEKAGTMAAKPAD
jgi:tetratricopeptide (TPR) repeat protein